MEQNVPMRALRGVLAIVALVLGVVAVLPSSADAATTWQVVRLQPLHEAETTHVADINASGTSVGTSGASAVKWSPEGTPTALEMPEGCTSASATAVADTGLIAGTAVCDSHLVGIIWEGDGSAVPMEQDLLSDDINDVGVVVGQRNPGTANQRAFAFLHEFPRVDLNSLDQKAAARAVNNAGLVVGDVENVPGLPSSVAVGWYGSYVFPLGPGGVTSTALAVTKDNVVLVQLADLDGTHPRGLLIGPKGQTVALSSNGNSDLVTDLAVNGVVVGTRTTGTGQSAVAGGGFYFGTSFTPFSSLVSSEVVSTFKLAHPTAVNAAATAVGNDAGGSWALRVVTDSVGGPPTTASTVPSTTSSTTNTTIVAPPS
jgi:hypothetical protein